MDIASYLDPMVLKIQFGRLKDNFTAHISAYEELKKKICEEILNAECLQGDTANALRAFHEDFCQLLELVVLANEMDIADAEKVIAELESVESPLEDATEELDGIFIITSLEDAKCKEDLYNRLAEEYIRAADECGILEGILEAAYRHEAEEYRRKSEIECERKEMYQAKVNRYDRIEANTKGCFMEAVELRRLAKNILDGFAAAFLDGEYQPDRINLYRREMLRCIASEDRWLESGINLYKQYLTEHVDFPTEEIENIMDELIVKYPHMLRQLAVLNTYSGNDYQALLSELNIKAQMCALLQTMEGVQIISDIENTETYRILLQSDYAEQAYTLAYVYEVMCQKYEQSFVLGMMANIYDEGGAPGRIEGFSDNSYWESDNNDFKNLANQIIDNEDMIDTLQEQIPLGTSGIGIGLCQWSGDRRDVLLDFYKKFVFNYDPECLLFAELAFMMDELGDCLYSADECYKNIPTACIGMNPSECARYIWRNYEKSNYEQDGDERERIANNLSELFPQS